MDLWHLIPWFALSLVAAFLAWRARKFLFPERALAKPALGGDLIVFGLLTVVGSGFVRGAFSGVETILGRSFSIYACLAGIAGIIVWLVGRSAPGRDAFGLSLRRLSDAPIPALLTYATVLSPLLLVHELNRAFLRDAGQEDLLQKTQHELASLTSEPLALVLMSLILVVAVPFFEEVIFRGCIQGGLQRKLGEVAGPRAAAVLAVLIAGTVFTLVHESFTWIPIGLLALVLGWLYARTANLWIPFLVHALHNLVTIIAQLAGGE